VEVEVFNCGISGTCTAFQLSKAAEFLHLDPDVVVLYEGVNDVFQLLPFCGKPRRSTPSAPFSGGPGWRA
jgi:hypothetical protein